MIILYEKHGIITLPSFLRGLWLFYYFYSVVSVKLYPGYIF